MDPLASIASIPEALACETGPPLEAAEPFGPPAPCNGYPQLCDRRLDKVVFATTHNSYAAQLQGYVPFNANQYSGIGPQLRDGIRALMLDVHRDGGELALCHGLCALGRTPHRRALEGIRNFLEERPREVLVLLYEDYVAPTEIESDFASLGLERYAFVHAAGEAWPTLGQMIESGARLLVFGERGSPPPAWYHSLWDLASDSPFGQRSISDFDCRLNRGRRGRPLFLMNHWLNTALDLPWEEGAAAANQLEVLYPRTMDCIQETRKLPNFIAVNYYERGDLLGLVELLNGVQFDPDFLKRALDALRGMRRPSDFLLFGQEVQPWPPLPSLEAPDRPGIFLESTLALRP